MSGRRASGIRSSSQRVETGEVALLEQLEGRSPTGGDVVDLAREAELGDRRGGVAPADDGETPALGDRLGDGAGAGREARVLEDTHRPVPEDGAGLADDVGELGGGARPDVEAHPSVGQARAR